MPALTPLAVGHGAEPGPPDAASPAGDWRILIQDRRPAYIPWEAYERNQRQLAANRSKHVRGRARRPVAAGRAPVLRPMRPPHGHLLSHQRAGRAVQLHPAQINRGEAACQCSAGRTLDAFVTDLVLEALRPSAIEVSLQLAEDIELERSQQHRHWTLRLERARYEVERAERQYDPVEPENRLVARTFEKRWEEALATVANLRTSMPGSWPASLPG